MSATFVGQTSSAVSGTSVAVNKPAGTVSGDIILIAIDHPSGGDTTVLPSGFTEVTRSPSGRLLILYTKTAGAAEPTSYTFSGGVYQRAAVAASYRGTTGVSATAVSYTATNQTVLTAPTVSAPTPRTIVSFWGLPSAFGGASTPDAGSTERLYEKLYDRVGTGSGTSLTSGGRNGSIIAAALAVPNVAPNAPTLTTMTGGVSVSPTAINRASHTFSDPDSGDSQSKFDLRYRLVGAATWTDIVQVTPNQFYDFPAGSLASGNYERQVRTYDAVGLVGPYTASGFFAVGSPPTIPTITYPINGQNVAQSETLTWSTPEQDAYQVRKVADSAGAPNTAVIYFDTGTVEQPTTRNQALTFDVNSRTEHVQVRRRVTGLWSEWTSVSVIVSFSPPATPVVTIVPDDAAARIVFAIVNPTPVGTQVAVSYNNVYIDDGKGAGFVRHAVMLAPNTPYTYLTPVGGRNYVGQVRVDAVGTNGILTSGFAQ